MALVATNRHRATRRLVPSGRAGERQIVAQRRGWEDGAGRRVLQRLSVAVIDLLGHGQCIAVGEGGRTCRCSSVAAAVRSATRVVLVELLRRHAPSWLIQLPGYSTRRNAKHSSGGSGDQPRRMLREIATLVTALPAPLMLLLEDLHWSDRATLDVADYAATRPRAADADRRVSADRGDRAQPPLRTAKDLLDRGRCRDVWLAPLTESGVTTYLKRAGPISRTPPPWRPCSTSRPTATRSS
jgi:hypothetical protein